MKKIIFTVGAFLFVTGATAFAQSPVYGTGTAYNMCNGMNFSYCMPQVQEMAKDKAMREMSFICDGRSGGIVSSPTCNTFCNPNWMNPDQTDTMVSCRSDCSAYCEN